MRTFGLLLFFFTGTLTGYSQVLLSNGGGYHTHANGSLTFSKGEPVINTLSAGNYILSQGVNQTQLPVTAIDKSETGFDLHAGPNCTNPSKLVQESTGWNPDQQVVERIEALVVKPQPLSQLPDKPMEVWLGFNNSSDKELDLYYHFIALFLP